MKARHVAGWVILGMINCIPMASALEFRSVKESTGVFYELPSLTSQKLFVVSRYYPVEVLTVQKEWVRVRDVTGSIAWMLATTLSSQAMLLVVADEAKVRETADGNARILFSVAKDGVFEMIGAPSAGWVQVKYCDGLQGYVRIVDVWGL